jgi:hypothetical protein
MSIPFAGARVLHQAPVCSAGATAVATASSNGGSASSQAVAQVSGRCYCGGIFRPDCMQHNINVHICFGCLAAVNSMIAGQST